MEFRPLRLVGRSHRPAGTDRMIQTRFKVEMNKQAAALRPKVGIGAPQKSHGGRSLVAGLQTLQKVNLAARLALMITNVTEVNRSLL